MSYQVMAWARSIKTGSTTVKAVLMAVANYADENGVSWPSQDQLAEDVEASRHTVLRALNVLAERDILRRERRHRGDGSRSSDRIILNLSYVAESNVAHSNVAGTNVANDPGPMLQPATAEPVREYPLKEKGRARGTRLPEDWTPAFNAIAFGDKYGLSASDVSDQLERFGDYWRAVSGEKGRKLDWDGTLRNWLRRAADDNRSRSPPGRHSKPTAWQRQAQAFEDLRNERQQQQRPDESLAGPVLSLPRTGTDWQ